VIRLGECASTNDVARRLAAAGLPEGTAIIAAVQTRGRGRHGRAWSSPAGGLWCSILLRPAPPGPWGPLSLAAGLATAEAIERAAGLPAELQWPNDVLVLGRKVAGVLLEGDPEVIIAGIGINANIATADLPAALRARAGSLRELRRHPVVLEDLFGALRARLAHWSERWSRAADAAGIIEAWAARDVLRGLPVRVAIGADLVEGIADGVERTGALRVRTPDGAVRAIAAGDLAAPLLAGARDGRSEPEGV
jgi:BirA family biotin operon repressor/biotin-[acetyl-CoA-carboxylase] ligase